tara:strand:+ start:70282 stop:70731 length:450 start_codon:yes stop_codon:yes gene_type:complete
MGHITVMCLAKPRDVGQINAMRLLFLLAFASPVYAGDGMTAAEFDAYTAGKTLTFGSVGNPAYGVEQYQPNRRVVWSFLDGECSNGVWYESKGSICFRYDSDPEPKCWKFYDEPDGLRAVFMNRPDTSALFEARDSREPLICPGPNLGS